jgi:hypothetical protein
MDHCTGVKEKPICRILSLDVKEIIITNINGMIHIRQNRARTILIRISEGRLMEFSLLPIRRFIDITLFLSIFKSFLWEDHSLYLE